jgi:acetylornithine deacetylase/succinyl-diaminopimelate desuccinylase-like protein
MSDLTAILDHVDGNLDHSLARLFDLLRIPSISTDPAYRDECRRAGQWLVDDLNGLGFDASLRDTPGHPMVVAHYAGPEGSPHVLFYGHYDVQPADPLEKWNTPPFEPQLVVGEDGSSASMRAGPMTTRANS